MYVCLCEYVISMYSVSGVCVCVCAQCAYVDVVCVSSVYEELWGCSMCMCVYSICRCVCDISMWCVCMCGVRVWYVRVQCVCVVCTWYVRFTHWNLNPGHHVC